MTAIEKCKVENMRRQGLGATKIASAIGVSVNTVKAHCRRNAISDSESKQCVTEHGYCKQCSRPVEQIPHRKVKLFCSNTCRLAWWNIHREVVSKRSTLPVTCACCGRPFDSYAKEKRKYCSHECYIKDRFWRSSNQ